MAGRTNTILCSKCHERVEDGAQSCPSCGEPTPIDASSADTRIQQKVMQHFVIRERIARGGMGEVYIAEHEEFHHRIAIKFLHRRFADDEELAERFLQEARAACRVRHNYAVAINDIGRLTDGTLYIAMEYVDGVSLGRFMRRHGKPMASHHVVRIAQQACEVLAEAHRHQIIHRDIKPDNIMLVESSTGRPSIKVLDFGIAKILNDERPGLTQTGVMFGTPEYMSPEQASGGEIGTKTDIYSLGLVLYFMLVGHPPFEGQNKLQLIQRQIKESPPAVERASPAKIPPELAALVNEMLAKDPSRRPGAMTDVLQRLDAIAIKQGPISAEEANLDLQRRAVRAPAAEARGAESGRARGRAGRAGAEQLRLLDDVPQARAEASQGASRTGSRAAQASSPHPRVPVAADGSEIAIGRGRDGFVASRGSAGTDRSGQLPGQGDGPSEMGPPSRRSPSILTNQATPAASERPSRPAPAIEASEGYSLGDSDRPVSARPRRVTPTGGRQSVRTGPVLGNTGRFEIAEPEPEITIPGRHADPHRVQGEVGFKAIFIGCVVVLGLVAAAVGGMTYRGEKQDRARAAAEGSAQAIPAAMAVKSPPPRPVDEAKDRATWEPRVVEALALIQQGRETRARNLYNEITKATPVALSELDKLKGQLDTAAAARAEIDGFLAAHDCRAADEVVIRLRNGLSKKLSENYHSKLNECRAAVRDGAKPTTPGGASPQAPTPPVAAAPTPAVQPARAATAQPARTAAAQPARPAAQPARPAAQPARPAAQPARPAAQPARPVAPPAAEAPARPAGPVRPPKEI